MELNNKDLELLKEKGITREQINQQIESFNKGFPDLYVEKAATINDGILRLSENEINEYIQHYNDYRGNIKIEKFVPASGAASRMFKKLYEFVNENKNSANPSYAEVQPLFEKTEKTGFYVNLKDFLASKGKNIEALIEKKKYVELVECLISENGLNYGNLPKALIDFHRYENETRTSLEEHLIEGAMYAKGKGKNVYVHFTVSPEHMNLFKNKIKDVQKKFEKRFQVKFHISYSTQAPSTDTIAVDMNNEPFRLDDGTLLFRPGGHGALLQNLNQINAELVFIKNIDNVVPDRIKGETVKYKSVLGGYILMLRERINSYIQLIDQKKGQEILPELEAFIQNTLFIRFPGRYYGWKDYKKVEYIRNKLDRPIRVCGMVKNEGEPGGGPFLAENRDGSISPQILESSQINMEDPEQKEKFDSATHFNPVDIVCITKNHEGKLFDLQKFKDPNTGFISKKSKDGRNLKALELPGLWNGSMSDWNTVFIEVPVITFNPVKTIFDLLRREHQ